MALTGGRDVASADAAASAPLGEPRDGPRLARPFNVPFVRGHEHAPFHDRVGVVRGIVESHAVASRQGECAVEPSG